ncbi:MAG: hypothetical protein WBX25_07950, partial [Rhodomicrobium sp.]
MSFPDGSSESNDLEIVGNSLARPWALGFNPFGVPRVKPFTDNAETFVFATENGLLQNRSIVCQRLLALPFL